MARKWVIASVMTLFGFGAVAFAQREPSPNSWGVTGAFSDFTLPSGVIPGNKNVAVGGYDGKFGLVYGREYGGDWEFLGVVKQFSNFKYDNTASSCVSSGACITGGSSYTGNPRIMGGEVRKYVHFKNFHRWQIGMNLGVGVGAVTGNIQQQQFTAKTVAALNTTTGAFTFTPTQGPTITTSESASSELSKALGMSIMPLFEAQFVVAVNVTRNFKLKFSGGADFPGVGGEVAGVYYFHHR